ncbi:MAG TPA: response regulator [Tepidisphaeraceae bacterium]|jgi:RNA polymerase sigma factor (sigma-70 family)|nr:response regulator [Tepidisphaeraceae bacterium]
MSHAQSNSEDAWFERKRPSDDSLLGALRFDQIGALDALYDRYAGAVMAMALRMVRDRALAEAVVVEVFFDLWEHPDSGGRPLMNRLLSHARGLAVRGRTHSTSPITLPPETVPCDEPEGDMHEPPDMRWKRERARAALAEVPAQARQIVELAYLDAMGFDEVALRLELAPGEVRAIFASGMRAFSEALKRSPAAAKPLSPFDFPTVNLSQVRVLIVDDEPDARRAIAFTLQSVGAEVTTAGSAAEALRLLSHANPQVLVSDLAMPSEDGFDLIRTIRRAGRTARDLPAIALTAFSTKPVRRQTMLAGFQMHVPKPVDPCQLTEVVATFAGRTG